ncbi:MAG: heme exporter protein CcmB [Anaerolineae bacterium]|nr:heme exporter protein CcmB [Anaerolineae bacterium]
MIPAAWAIFQKDLRAEWRSRELLSAMLLFSFLSVFVFSFALELQRDILIAAASGVLWVSVIFAVILGLNRSMAAEREMGNLDAMLLAPIDRSAIFVGKAAANFLFGLIVGVILLPVISLVYNVNLLDLRMVGLVALGTLGLASVGTLLAAMTVQTRAREMLLPIVMLPAILPILLLVVRASNGVLGLTPEEFWVGIPALLIVLDVIYVVMCFLLFSYVLED